LVGEQPSFLSVERLLSREPFAVPDGRSALSTGSSPRSFGTATFSMGSSPLACAASAHSLGTSTFSSRSSTPFGRIRDAFGGEIRGLRRWLACPLRRDDSMPQEV
jgi:hypothetical protein